MTELAIRNMVCQRCIEAVQKVLKDIVMPYTSVRLGAVVLEEEPAAAQLDILSSKLKQKGFELLVDHKEVLVNRIRDLIIQLVRKEDLSDLRMNLMAFLSAALHRTPAALSELFSSKEGITIEKFFISQKIERVKELLSYNDLTLTQIAFQMGYSSVAHLSSQFKKMTGLTPSQYRSSDSQRKALDQL